MAVPRRAFLCLLGPALGACADLREQDMAAVSDTIGAVLGTGGGGLSQDEIARGLREALEIGTERAVDDLAVTNAFFSNPEIHIPLPGALGEAQNALRPLGLAGLLDDLELSLNRGAEQAMPAATRIFGDAIAQLTFQDVIDIWLGPDDAATRYFQRTTSSPLSDAMRSPVRSALDRAGAVRLYDQIIRQAGTVPGMPDLRADLTDHVLGLALPALFDQVALEEARIREDPVARTTDLLERVFGSPAA